MANMDPAVFTLGWFRIKGHRKRRSRVTRRSEADDGL